MTGIEALNAICAECQQDKGKIQVACPWRSISGDYCEEYETLKRCIERLAELEDKIEDGTLVELPCKVGDKVYWVDVSAVIPTIKNSTVTGFMWADKLYVLFGSDNRSYESADDICFSYEVAQKKQKELAEKFEQTLKEMKGDLK